MQDRRREPTGHWNLDAAASTSAGKVACGVAGDGPPLVLAHGWPWSSFSWHRIIPALSTQFRVHWYDMPGFGRSELSPRRPPSLVVQGEVFAEMLEHWRLDAPTVVAHDFGGTVTLRAHLLHGRDFASLVLMNVVAMRPWGSAFFEHVKSHLPAFTGLPPHIHAAIVRAYIDSALVHALPADGLEAPWLAPAGRAAFWRQFELADEVFTAEMEPQYGALRCPAAILWGADDPWIPMSRGMALAERVGVALTPLRGLGHLPQLEAPDAVLQELSAHLSRQ
ncbi:alpha/beta fold hydrolase [Histidinibacterium lentulum]|uniref:Alpha/beta hydrolase n=1 Tax=Histidinibacterium lentulum TaxID=2480588 RepID=A0A3N2QY82_9RHOB|nr:alpha/beta hydrolase [Histidinibacterium lentulum]ROU00172.1 alpha/beta hydrolase [Histidinibacterium lentulum]